MTTALGGKVVRLERQLGAGPSLNPAVKACAEWGLGRELTPEEAREVAARFPTWIDYLKAADAAARVREGRVPWHTGGTVEATQPDKRQ